MMMEEEGVAARWFQGRLVLARRLHVGIQRPLSVALGEWNKSRRSLGIAVEAAPGAGRVRGPASRADGVVGLAAGIDGTQAGEVLAMEVELFAVGSAAGLAVVEVVPKTAEKGPDAVVEVSVEDPADPDTVPKWAAKNTP